MEQIQLAYGFFRNCYCFKNIKNNTKAMVRPPDIDTDFFDIHTEVLPGDTLAAFL